MHNGHALYMQFYYELVYIFVLVNVYTGAQ